MHLQQFDLLAAGLGAQNEADGSLLIISPLVAIQPLEVELHLALVRRLEATQLQLDRYQPAQGTRVEQQVKVEVVVVDRHPLLASNEGPTVADLQQEGSEVVDDRLFKVSLVVGAPQTQEVEQVRVAKTVGGHRGPIRRLHVRDLLALETLTADELPQPSDAQPRGHCLFDIELTSFLRRHRQQRLEVSPTQLLPQRGHNLRIREHLRELHHPMQARPVKAAAEPLGQVWLQRGHNPLGVARAPLMQHFYVDHAADVPVHQGQGRVDVRSHGCPGLLDQGRDALHERTMGRHTERGREFALAAR